MSSTTFLYAAITGDVIDSTKLLPTELESVKGKLLAAAKTIEGWKKGLVKGSPDFFRGDAWRMLLTDPAYALRASILIRASLLSIELERTKTGRLQRVDSRLAAGIGILVATLITHLAMDALKAHRMSDGAKSFSIDQVFHFIVIVLLAWLCPGVVENGLWKSVLVDHLPWFYVAMTLVSGIILTVPAGGILIGKLTEPIRQEIKESPIVLLPIAGKQAPIYDAAQVNEDYLVEGLKTAESTLDGWREPPRVAVVSLNSLGGDIRISGPSSGLYGRGPISRQSIGGTSYDGESGYPKPRGCPGQLWQGEFA